MSPFPRRPGQGRVRARSRGQGPLNTAIESVHNMSEAVLKMVQKVTQAGIRYLRTDLSHVLQPTVMAGGLVI